MKDVPKLADSLFRRIEQSQGFFFVSDDGGGDMTEEQFFERVRGRLAWGRKAVKIMDSFLREHGETDGQRSKSK